jgi:hypothetical protein
MQTPGQAASACRNSRLVETVRDRQHPFLLFVIPAKAGIQ